MNALAMPSSSRIAADRISPCFWTTSPRMREERSATDWATRASSALSVGLAGCIPHDAIRAGGAPCLPGVIEVVQMSYRLAHCEKSLVRVERPAKKHRQQVPGAALAVGQLALERGKTRAVVLLQVCHPVVRAAKGFPMRRQHQHIGRQLAVAPYRIEEQAQRIAFRVYRPDADIGRDGREQHVAGNDHVQRFAVERHVLRSMTVADDRAPVMTADTNAVVLDEAPVGMRKLRHQLGVAIAVAGHGAHASLVEAVAPKDIEHRLAGVAGGALAHGVRREVFALRRPEPDAEPAAEPRRVARMVWMVVGQDHALHLAERRENLLPQRACLLVADTAVDDRRPVTVLEQPQVDMV